MDRRYPSELLLIDGQRSAAGREPATSVVDERIDVPVILPPNLDLIDLSDAHLLGAT